MWLKYLLVALFAFAAVGCASIPENTSKRSECTGPKCSHLGKESEHKNSEDRMRWLDRMYR